MGIEVTIDLPETIYQEVEQIAQETQRRVNDVLAEIVIRSFPPLYDGGEEYDALDREGLAFEAMHSELWAKYPNEYVAIYQGQVIDHDIGELVLLDRINLNHPGKIIMVDQVLPQLRRELVFRSPRFATEL